MAKEIYEQPEVVGHTLTQYLDMAAGTVRLPFERHGRLGRLSRLSVSACGTAYYAGLTAKYWFEKLARLPVEIDSRDSAFQSKGASKGRRGTCSHVQIFRQRMADDLRLLMDLLGHEMMVVALLDQESAGGDALRVTLHLRARGCRRRSRPCDEARPSRLLPDRR